MQQTIVTKYRKIKNYLVYAKNFVIRKNPIKKFFNDCVAVIKDMFSVKQKKKIATYRLNYQIHKLHQMESLIAENNEHTFLRGTKFNEMR